MSADTRQSRTELTWFEIPAADFDRATRFYEAVLAMPLERQHDPVMGAMAIFPTPQGGSMGAVTLDPRQSPGVEGTMIYLHVGDLDAALDRSLAQGGSVLQARVELPGDIGWVAVIRDSEGNRVGLHQRP
jgi:hypothetical protein